MPTWQHHHKVTAVHLLALTILFSGCRPASLPPHPQPLPPFREATRAVQLRRVEQAGKQRLSGYFAEAGPGDFLLENGRIAVTVAGLAGGLPGAILDAGLPGARDGLRSVAPIVGVEPKEPLFERAEIDYLDGAAKLRLRGVDPADPSVQVICEYTLRPDARTVTVSTKVRNRGRALLHQYKLGDRIDWGAAEPFAPGVGRTPSGRPVLEWLGAFTPESSYLYFRQTSFAADFSGMAVRTLLETLDLPAGGEASVSRELAVGAGGQITDLLPVMLAAQGIPTGTLDVVVFSDQGEPLPGATLEIQRGAGLLALGRTDSAGTARLELPAGTYLLRASAPDRLSSASPITVDSKAGTSLRLQTGPPSRLLFEVHDERSPATVPARLVLLGLDGTPTPWLGPAYAEAAHNQLLTATGSGALPLPPGRYRVFVTRGPEYTLEKQDLELRPHSGASLIVKPRKVVDSSGLVALDAGALTRLSPNSAVSSEARLLSASSEGLAAVALPESSHPQVAMSPPDQLVHPGMVVLPGLSGRNAELGTFSLIGAAPREGVPLGGAASLVLQLDGARQPSGLLGLSGFDPAHPRPELLPPEVSALRVLDAEHPEDFDQLMADWFALLRCGRRIAATAGSGSRSVAASTAGYPRIYVEQPAGTPATTTGLLGALQAGRAVVSSGPLLRVTANGTTPGGTVSLTKSGLAKSAPRRARRGKPAVRGELSVRVQISAPAWIGLDEVRLYWNGQQIGAPLPIPGRADGVRLDQTTNLAVDGDGFLVVLARGNAPLAPVVATPGQLRPLALSNPIWVDADGDHFISLVCRSTPSSASQPIIRKESSKRSRHGGSPARNSRPRR